MKNPAFYAAVGSSFYIGSILGSISGFNIGLNIGLNIGFQYWGSILVQYLGSILVQYLGSILDSTRLISIVSKPIKL